MTLQEIIIDMHALYDELLTFERKYGVLSETFYESYLAGEEPEEDAWVLDCAGAHKIYLRRQEQYRRAIQALRQGSQKLVSVIERTARHESI